MTAKRRSKTLVADTDDSVCFSDLRWRDGVVYATFARDNTQYAYDVDRATAKEWFAGDLGEFFNAEIR
jgi:hypothetical protein